MLQDLFPRDHKRYDGSRFGAELEAFADWLATQGHLRHPLRLHLHRVRRVLDGCDRFRPGGVFKEEDLRHAFIVPGPGAYEYLCTGRIFARFLAAVDRLVPVEHTDALSPLRHRYHHYVSEVRGFSKQSLKQHGATVADFLSRGLPPDRGLSGRRPRMSRPSSSSRAKRTVASRSSTLSHTYGRSCAIAGTIAKRPPAWT